MTNAAQFNATGERLTRSTGPSPNAAYTVAFWVRVDSYRNTDYQTLFTFLQGGSEWEAIMLDASNRLVIEAGVGGSGSRVNAASAYGTGTWKYVALVRSSTTSLKAYVDGTEMLSLTTNVSSRSAAVSEFAFGSDTYNEDSNSSVAYARAWTAALNTTELAAEKTSATAVRTTDLWGDWPMQANGNDSSGNSRTLSANGTVSYVTDGPTWSQTITPTGIASAEAHGVAAVSAAGGGAQTISPSAIASAEAFGTATAAVAPAGQSITPTGIATGAAFGSATLLPGAVSIQPTGVASVFATGTTALLMAACIGGTIQVDATNPRYFSAGGNILLLSGFHTWESVTDHGDTDPPDAFDYGAYLDACVAKGTNFVKLWAASESLKDWCDVAKYLDPPIYQRTGPGNAADGKPKVDLTLFNQAYFDRLRARAIEAGNRGMYVCVQLFQGWQVTQKGYAVGSPGVYHPYNAANNINGIDGDTDNDGQVGETRDITWAAIFNLQKAYVAKVVDTVGDLDNVIFEISNEEDESGVPAGQTVDWQHALIDYIHTYEAGRPKQHPVGMTVQWPSGSDSDLFASNAEWISPKDGSNLTTVTASSGDKVILYDTDHVVGLTDTWQWVWRAFTRGLSPLYMDEWDGEFYGVDKRLATANERIRANLGYVLDYASRMDLANSTPQSALASTGFAIGKLTGLVKLLAYQDASGAFTVNLTSISGTFSLEWLRTSTGATQAGSSVSGGAVRTLTPPWAGEDVVAFLELTELTIAPSGIASGAAFGVAAVQPGAIVISCTGIASAEAFGSTTAQPGAVTVTPAGIGTAEAHGATSTQPGAVTVVPAGVATAEAFGAALVQAGASYIAPAGIASAEAHSLATIQPSAVAIVATGIASAEAHGAATVVPGAVSILASGIDTAEAFGPSALLIDLLVTATGIATGEAFGTALLSVGGAFVQPSGIAGGEAFGTLRLLVAGSDQYIDVPSVQAGETFGVVTLLMALIAERTFSVQAEARRYVVAAEKRTYSVQR